MTDRAGPHDLTRAPDHDRPHDACGVGFVARADGIDSHGVVELALHGPGPGRAPGRGLHRPVG